MADGEIYLTQKKWIGDNIYKRELFQFKTKRISAAGTQLNELLYVSFRLSVEKRFLIAPA